MLLNRVFKPWAKGMEYFRWKYQEYSTPFTSFPRAWTICDGHKIIAFNGYLPCQVKMGNRTVLAVQSFDTVTDPDYQGQGLFGILQDRVCEEMKKHNIAWVYGWTSPVGFKAFTLRAGWRVWANQRFLLRILNREKFLGDKTRNPLLVKAGELGMRLLFHAPPLPKGWNGKVVEVNIAKSGNEMDAFLERVQSAFGFIILRKREYIKWRLAHPYEKYKVFFAMTDNSIKGYMAARINEKENCLDILDSLVDNEDALHALLFHLEEAAQKEHLDLIRFRINEKHSYMKTYKKCGYFWSRTKFPLLGRSVSDDPYISAAIFGRHRNLHWSLMDRNE